MERVEGLGVDRHSLDYEIDLSRAILVRLTKIYDLALQSDTPEAESARVAIEGAIQDGLCSIAEMVSKSQKVREANGAAIASEAFAWVLSEVGRVLDEQLLTTDPALRARMLAALSLIQMPFGGGRAPIARTAADEKFL
jgi:hypothetical protein